LVRRRCRCVGAGAGADASVIGRGIAHDLAPDGDGVGLQADISESNDEAEKSRDH
jgi:hypothetical protein